MGEAGRPAIQRIVGDFAEVDLASDGAWTEAAPSRQATGEMA